MGTCGSVIACFSKAGSARQSQGIGVRRAIAAFLPGRPRSPKSADALSHSETSAVVGISAPLRRGNGASLESSVLIRGKYVWGICRGGGKCEYRLAICRDLPLRMARHGNLKKNENLDRPEWRELQGLGNQGAVRSGLPIGRRERARTVDPSCARHPGWCPSLGRQAKTNTLTLAPFLTDPYLRVDVGGLLRVWR